MGEPDIFCVSEILKTSVYFLLQNNLGSFHLKPHNFWPKKDSWSQIFFSVKYTSIGSIRVHNPEYQPPVTSSSRETGCTNFVI